MSIKVVLIAASSMAGTGLTMPDTLLFGLLTSILVAVKNVFEFILLESIWKGIGKCRLSEYFFKTHS